MNIRIAKNKQLGASSLSILFMIFCVAALVTVGVKIGPLYMNNMSIDQAIESASSRNFHNMSKDEIRETLGKTFRVNGVSVDPRDIKIEKNQNSTVLSYFHEERVNIHANVDVIVTFTNTFDTADQ